MSRGVPSVAYLICLTLAAACRPAAADLTVEQLTVSLNVLTDGSVEVSEQWRVRFGGTPASTFVRRAPVWRHDGVFAVVATMDGKELPRGDFPGHVQVGDGAALDVRWRFAPASGRTHVFGLEYRAANAVAVSGIRGGLSWRVLPAGREWPVESAQVTLTLPATAIPLEDPWVDEAGWNVTRTPRGLAATRTSLSREESVTVGQEFTIDTLAIGEPAWQYHGKRAQDLLPAFVSAGLFMIVVGAGVLLMLRIKYPPRRGTGGVIGESSLSPAMKIAIARGRCRGDVREVLAALQGLEARGVSRERPDVPGLTEHERLIADELWFAREGEAWSAAQPRRPWRRRFRRALLADLVAAGLVDRERIAVVRDLRVAGLVTVAVAAAVWVAVAVAFHQYGRWVYAVPAGMLIAGLMFFIASYRFPILSDNGGRLRERVLYSARVRDGRTSA